ncbi:MAG: hypothetical protein ACHBN1_15550 [Heteroscytonema crispum UTEX LB 1556]
MATSTVDNVNKSVSNSLAVGGNPFGGSSPSGFNSNSSPFGGSSSGASDKPIWQLGGNSGNSYAGAKNNPFAGGGGKPFASYGNVVVGNSQWILGSEIAPERFASVVSATIDEMVGSVFDKLRSRLPLDEANKPSTENPFANGNNPFGEGNEPKLPALDFLKSTYGENFPLPSGGVVDFLKGEGTLNGTGTQPSNSDQLTGIYNPDTAPDSGEDLLVSTGNPTVGGGSSNPFAGGGSGNPSTSGSASSQPSFDISKLIFGNTIPSLNGSGDASTDGSVPQQSSSEILRNVQAAILNFTGTLNSAGGDIFGGNNTPFKTPSDLLTLFRNDMYSFNSGVNAVNELASGDKSSAGGSNPLSQFAGGGSPDGQIPFDILSVALDGILPFNGSDNVFMTPEGELPIGYGNRDFGSDNATIGNANWDYGKSNATIGNGNWHWDSSTENATIGNGNWHLDSSKDNKTIGNGNWYWESTSDNTTLGNGNWHFGNNNTTIGNGNWDFGSNNTIIGNSNRVFTSNSIVVGNGNWSVIIDKSTTGASDFLTKLDTLVLGIGIKDAADNLVDSLMGKFGEVFQPLTGNLSKSGTQTFNQQFLSQSTEIIAP